MNNTSRRTDRTGVEKANYDSHLARIKQAKTSVDCQAPKPHPLLNRADVDQVGKRSSLPLHLFSLNDLNQLFINARILFFVVSSLQRRRYASIEYDNRILLARIATIIQSKPSTNEINETSDIYSTSKRELTKSRKKVELQKICDENHKLLKRIQTASSAYKVTEWDEHARVNELHKRNISAYPEYYEKIDRDNLLAKSGSPTYTSMEPSMKMRGQSLSSPNGHGINSNPLAGSVNSPDFLALSGRHSGEKVLPHLQGKRKTSIDKVFPDWKKKSDVLISGV